MASIALLPDFGFAAPEQSREMTKAINLYKAGRLNEAMDQFLEVLLNTNSAEERSLVNSYMNKISLDISKPSEPESSMLDPLEPSGSKLEEAFRAVDDKGKAATPLGLTPTSQEKAALLRRQAEEQAAKQKVAAPAVKQPEPAGEKKPAPGKGKAAAGAQEKAAPLQLTEPDYIPTKVQVASPDTTPRGQVNSVTLVPGMAPVRSVQEPYVPMPVAEPAPSILGLSTSSITETYPDAGIKPRVETDARAKAAAAAAAAGDKVLGLDVSGAEQHGAATSTAAVPAAPIPETPEDRAEKAKWLEKISQKISAMRQEAIQELQKTSGVTISLMDNGMPEAIGLSPDAIFVKGTVDYKPGAAGTLLRVASLLFTVGKANLVLLPEGTMTGNLGMLDMRRTMAINSWLSHRGLSPARLKANLTAVINQSFPEAFKRINGIGIVFEYDKDKELLQPLPDQNAPPMLSLGIYPSEIDVSKDEGALIEISAVETSAQIATWELQMLSGEGNKAVTVLKSISGTGPVYTQTYWNGRSAGQVVPSGLYACVLTAT
ncbi:MAG TPA: hypothetical protein PLL10_05370, partial [Elusimicrobiales bacterium]|nr:hypothetical protein [Elusimicrobiales bacterium]